MTHIYLEMRLVKASIMTIPVAPRFLVMPEDQEVTSNGRIDLECAAEGTPTPRVTWKVNNTDIPSEQSAHTHTRTHTHLLVSAHSLTHTHTCERTLTDKQTCAYTHSPHAYAHTHTRTRTHSRTHARTHARTHSRTFVVS